VKTFTNTQFYTTILFNLVLWILAATGPYLYITGKLAFVQRHDFKTLVSGIGEVKCSIVKFNSIGHVFTSIRGLNYTGDFSTHLGTMTTDTKIMTDSASITILRSIGSINFDSYTETDEDNIVGWACHKAGGELTTI
jgi:hypothetical protein